MPAEPIDEALIPEAAPAVPLSGLLRDSSLYFLGNVAFKIIGFIMIPFYAHFLSPEESGVLNLIELAIQIVAILFGLQAAGAALARIWHDQTDATSRHATVSTAIIGLGLTAAAVSALAAMFAVPLAAAVNLGGQAGLLRLAFCAMFFSSLGEMALVYERMQNRARFFLAYSTTTLVVTLSLNIVLIGYFRFGVAGFICAKLAVSMVGSLVLLTRIFQENGAAFRPALAEKLARFAAPLVVSGLAYFAIHFSDRLFLAHTSKAQVGVYSLAYNFAFLISVIIGDSFTKVWNVSLYSYASGEGYEARLAQVGRWLIFVLGLSAIGLSLFARDVLTLMVPTSYYPPAFMLPLLVFGYFLREVGDFFNSTLLVGKGSGLVGRIAVLGALLNLALNALLIPAHGIWGAACATFLTWAIYCAVCWIYAARRHRIPITAEPFTLILAFSGAALLARAGLAAATAPANLALDCALLAIFIAAASIFCLRATERREAYRAARRVATALGLRRK
jgi:O-antigen/teichoic acid export membrane protein